VAYIRADASPNEVLTLSMMPEDSVGVNSPRRSPLTSRYGSVTGPWVRSLSRLHLRALARPQPVTDELDDEIGDVGRGDAVVGDQPPVRQLTISAATL
jgi:hypothetical protein